MRVFLFMDKVAEEKYWEEKNKQLEDEKQNYKGPHCCFIMDYSVDKSNPQNISPTFYSPKFREYYLEATIGPGGRQINFCPYCGATLPQGLSDIWFDVLEKEYGLDNPAGPEQEKKVPAEFKTDEWWKKRGL